MSSEDRGRGCDIIRTLCCCCLRLPGLHAEEGAPAEELAGALVRVEAQPDGVLRGGGPAGEEGGDLTGPELCGGGTAD